MPTAPFTDGRCDAKNNSNVSATELWKPCVDFTGNTVCLVTPICVISIAVLATSSSTWWWRASERTHCSLLHIITNHVFTYLAELKQFPSEVSVFNATRQHNC